MSSLFWSKRFTRKSKIILCINYTDFLLILLEHSNEHKPLFSKEWAITVHVLSNNKNDRVWFRPAGIKHQNNYEDWIVWLWYHILPMLAKQLWQIELFWSWAYSRQSKTAIEYIWNSDITSIFLLMSKNIYYANYFTFSTLSVLSI